MILNSGNQTSDVQIVGEVKSNKVGIDSKNLDFITQILSTNLYSNPFESFLREAISNADDSHIEAGTDKPIILELGTLGSKYFIRIQDFGTGISKEKFNAIYRYIGSSTKRESNKYTGAFGLGKFASLAISDSVIITSICGGYKTQYLMYKDALAIKIDEISSEPTTEHNGVEILVYLEAEKMKQYCRDLDTALQKLVFFDKLFVETSTLSDYGYFGYAKRAAYTFNKREITVNNTFSLAATSNPKRKESHINELCVKYGKVLYPLRSDRVDIPERWINTLPFAINVEIGKLDVTPNREQLLYSTKTTGALNDAIKEMLKEFKQSLAKSYTIELNPDTLPKIVGSVYLGYFNPNYYSGDAFITYEDLELKVSKALYTATFGNLLYKGTTLGSDLVKHLFRYISNFCFFNITLYKRATNEHFTYKKDTQQEAAADIIGNNQGRYDYGTAATKYFLWQENVNAGTRRYLEDTYKGRKVVVLNPNLKELKSLAFNMLDSTPKTEREATKKAIKIGVKLVQDFVNTKIEKLYNSNTPAEYYERKQKTGTSEKKTRVLRLNSYDNYEIISDDLSSWCGSCKGLVIYCTADDELFLKYIVTICEKDILDTFNNKLQTHYTDLYKVKISKAGVTDIKDKPNWIRVTELFESDNNLWLMRLNYYNTYYNEAAQYRRDVRDSPICRATQKLADLTDKLLMCSNKAVNHNSLYYMKGEQLQFIQSLLETVPKIKKKPFLIEIGFTKEEAALYDKVLQLSYRLCILYTLNGLGASFTQEEKNSLVETKLFNL